MVTTTGTRRARSLRAPYTVSSCVLAILGSCGPLVHAETTFTPGVIGEAIYTDNIAQEPSGQERSEVLLHVAPGFRLDSMSRRFRANVDYKLNAYMFASDSSQNQIVHGLKSNAEAEVISDWAFLDADASMGQVVRDPSQRVPTSNVINNGNLVDSTVWNVMPSLRHRFGGNNTVDLSYEFGQVHYHGGGDQTIGGPLDDVDVSTARFRFDHEATGPLGWWMEYRRKEGNYEEAEDFRADLADGGFDYRIGSGFWLIGTGGSETDLTADQISGGLDSGFWTAGFRVAPSVNQMLTLTTGHRYFGHTYDGSYEYTGRTLSAMASYREETTTAAMASLDSARAPQTTRDTTVDPTLTPITSDVYISKTPRLSVTLKGRMNEIEFSAYSQQRTYIASDESERETTGSAAWRYRLGPRTTTRLGASLSRYTFRDSDRVDRFRQYYFGVDRQLGRRTHVDLTYRRYERGVDSQDPTLRAFAYHENSLTLSAQFTMR